MRFEEEHYTLDGKNIILRCAEKEDADMLIDYLKTVCGETRFLLVNADEVKYTTEQEESFIESMNDAEGKSLGFVETGRLPNASRYDDGTYSDDIFMVKEL